MIRIKICDQKSKAARKLRSRAGFSFTELLLACMIMMLATGLLTQTLDLAIRQFYRQTQESEAQILCSTIATYVESELSYATVTVTESGGTQSVSSFSSNVHGMGKNAVFRVEPHKGTVGDGKDIVIGSTETTPTYSYGYIVETSPARESEIGSPFNIAGEGSYTVGSNRSYDLDAGLALQWDSTGGCFAVSVKVVKHSDNDAVLDEKSFRVLPLSIEK